MTNRRSLQTEAARGSRQTQFVPGHVGGRVASAQPVRRRNTIGAVKGEEVAVVPPPEFMTVGHMAVGYGPSDSSVLTLPAFPVGMTSAVVLIHTCLWTDISTPAGWTVIAEGGPYGSTGTNGSPLAKWKMLKIDAATGAESLTFNQSGSNGTTYDGVAASYAYMVGGGGGTWNGELGEVRADQSTMAPHQPPGWSAGQPFVQFGAFTAVYGWTVGDATSRQGFGTSGDGPSAQAAHYPSGTLVDVATTVPRPASPELNYGTLGAIGIPTTASFVAYWTP